MLRTTLKQLLFILLLGLANSQTAAEPSGQLTLVGEAEMSYLFWDVYQVRLFTTNGNYQNQNSNLALVFDYQMDIKSDDLVRETEKQWRSQKLAKHSSESLWLADLKAIWPDIREGDRLTFHIDHQGSAHFYYNGSWTGMIDDQEFSMRFLQIWLSEKTTAPSVRQQLLGSSAKN